MRSPPAAEEVASVVARVAFALVVGTDSGTSDDLRDGLLDHHDVLAVFLVAALTALKDYVSRLWSDHCIRQHKRITAPAHL